jgi:hypothetical protein
MSVRGHNGVKDGAELLKRGAPTGRGTYFLPHHCRSIYSFHPALPFRTNLHNLPSDTQLIPNVRGRGHGQSGRARLGGGEGNPLMPKEEISSTKPLHTRYSNESAPLRAKPSLYYVNP